MDKVVKYFNSLVEKILFKLSNKFKKFIKFFNDNSKISNFNKLIISLISLLFLCLFYLSIPTLYDKNWVQNTLEDKLLKDYKMNFSSSSYITYNILPSPHFLIKNSEIYRDNLEKPKVFSEIKKLKVFININFFDKEKINIKKIIIEDANFFLEDNDFNFFNKISDKKIFNKDIKIINSDIFFKNNNNETIVIIKVNKAILCCQESIYTNLWNLNLEVFKVPFSLNFNSTTLPSEKKEINIKAKKLKLNIVNEYFKKSNNLVEGSNIISTINSKMHTSFRLKDNIITFESNKSKAKNSNINYNGILFVKPFDFKMDVNIKKYKVFKLINVNSIISEFIKARLLFNENISAKISINIDSNKDDEIFKSSVIYLNVVNGKVNFNKTKLINNKIGNLEVLTSNLSFKNDQLVLNTDIIFKVQNSKNLFSILQTPKNVRNQIKNILVNLDYDLLTNQLNINKIKIDEDESNNEIMNLIKEFNNSNDSIDYNFNKSKRIFNQLISAYAG